MPSIQPGDMLLVRGSGRLGDIGANGGFMGHVMVALASPTMLTAGSPEAQALSAIWPESADRIWKVATVESTRAHSGLHRSEVLLHAEQGSGKLVLIGELVATEQCLELSPVTNEVLEVWQCPSALRADFRNELITTVLNDMLDCEADWSLSTAARAVLRSAILSPEQDRSDLLAELENCWEAPPICTSVVITFWQRYLQRYAVCKGLCSIDLILKWMPLKADRGLPSELVKTMHQCGWVLVDAIQKHHAC